MKKFTCNAIKWFDKVNGNTYHSVRVIRHKDNKIVTGQFQYRYGEQYQQTALEEMIKAGWLPKKYNKENLYSYERENDYPIIWICNDGLKRECVANGTI